jgi:hypothetical protein
MESMGACNAVYECAIAESVGRLFAPCLGAMPSALRLSSGLDGGLLIHRFFDVSIAVFIFKDGALSVLCCMCRCAPFIISGIYILMFKLHELHNKIQIGGYINEICH